MRKYGTNDGSILPDKEGVEKTAAADWTPEDEKALTEENED